MSFVAHYLDFKDRQGHPQQNFEVHSAPHAVMLLFSVTLERDRSWQTHCQHFEKHDVRRDTMLVSS
jgi:hypothetical protein